LLIDGKHKRWIQATVVIGFVAVVGYLFLDRLSPHPLTGGSVVGLWYGIIGTALMIYAGLLSTLRRVPAWRWIGPRKVWLRGHIWLGLLSIVFLLCHSGFRWGGRLEQVLWIIFAGVILTGLFGLFLQQLVPRLMTTRVTSEAPYEQIPYLCQVMRRKADAMIDAICPREATQASEIESTRMAIQIAEDGPAWLRAFYEKDMRPFLMPRAPKSSPLLNPMRAEACFKKIRSLAGLGDHREQLDQLAILCEERRQMVDQERLHFWLHSWLAVHIPLCMALLVVGVVHVVTALYY
jgi:hypothetical protein